ncbi:MAG: AAA family ATPase, partial [Actinobacteria bacterium]|nr:AAA family ATPase [Actinomycetota bacterium]
MAALGQPGQPPPLAEAIDPLVAAALVTVDPLDPTDPNTPVGYQIHPGIAEAVHAATPEQVTNVVDTQLADWWTAVARWGIQQERAGQDTGQLVVRAGLSAAPYLLRQHHWHTASLFLEHTRARDLHSPITTQAVIPPLRRIAEATGQLRDLRVLASALSEVNPAKAQTLLRRVYDQARTAGDHHLASAAASDLVSLLRDQGRPREALTLIDQKIELNRLAGLGPWTQLGDQGQRLQILGLQGQHEQLLTELPVLRGRMVELPDERADNDPVDPWNVQETILITGLIAAVALGRWVQALDLNNEIITIMRRRGVSPHEMARTRFSDYGPLLGLGRQTEAAQLLGECQDVFHNAGDITMLGGVYGARADLEYNRGRLRDAVELQRTALRLRYVRPNPRDIATGHHNLAYYLSRAPTGNRAEQRAHRLAAALVFHLIGDVHHRTDALRALATELRHETEHPDAPALPTTVSE